MKKILTIIATAALCSTVATAAHAAEIQFLGSVGSSCELTVTPGSLDNTTGPATQIDSSTNPANAKVVCNGPSTLTVELDAGSSVGNGGEVAAYFRDGGPGGITLNSTPLGITPIAGTNLAIDGRIKTTGNAALLPAATNYKVVANVTLTAN